MAILDSIVYFFLMNLLAASNHVVERMVTVKKHVEVETDKAVPEKMN